MSGNRSFWILVTYMTSNVDKISSGMSVYSCAYVTVTSRNEVVAIDMRELAVVGTIRAGEEPMGLVLLDPSAPATEES